MSKKLLPVFILSLLGFQANAQITLTPTDTTICPGEVYTITGSFASQFETNNTDDYFSSDTVNIGFPFVFYGDTVTQCIISPNNFITFDLSLAGDHSAYQYNDAVSNGEVDNAIMFPFHDLDMSTATLNPNPGSINYQTFGSAPNRKFVVEFCHVPLWSCPSVPLVTDQVILYEGSNIIEMHITSKPSGCGSWGGTGIEGLKHGSTTDLVPGRDVVNVNWSAANDARRFTPNGTTGYTLDSIPFNPQPIIPDVDASDIVWYAEGNPTPMDTGSSVTVTASGSVHYYVATITGESCNDTSDFTYSDTSFVHMGTVHDTMNVDICQGETYTFYNQVLNQSGQYDTSFSTVGGCDSFIVLNLSVNPMPNMTLNDTTPTLIVCKGTEGTIAVANPSGTYNYQWYRDGVPITGATDSAYTTAVEGAYSVVIITNKGCTDTSKAVQVSVDTVRVEFDINPHLGCMNDTIQLVNHSEDGKYWWRFGDGTTPDDTTANPVHIYQQQDEYVVRLIVQNRWGCRDSLAKLVDVRHPLTAGFIQSADSLCQTDGTPVHFTDTSVGATHYFWDFGDGATATDQNPTHVYTLAGAHQVRQVISDNIPCYDTAIHMVYIDSLPFLKLYTDKTELCTGDEVFFSLDYLQTTAQQVRWSFGDGNRWDEQQHTHHSYDREGNYIATVTVDYPVCPPMHDSVSITVYALPVVDLGPDSALCLDGNPIFLTNHYAGNNPLTRWVWNTGDSTPVLKVVHPGTYSLTAMLHECSTTESVVIRKDCYTDVPNAFTPNNDGENDYFFPRQYLAQGVTAFRMDIYNRWGQKVYETGNLNGRGWDGKFNDKEQPTGVYIYQIDVTYKNGRKEHYSGNVTLIR